MTMIDTSRPASRILALLELLQDTPGLTGPQIADRLDVSGRTVRRYMTTLQDMGIPVEPTTGRNGGYQLRPGFRLPPLMFSAEEALGLSMALLATQINANTPLPHPVEAALGKIERVLPPEILERVNAVRLGTALPQGTNYDAFAFPDPVVLSSLAQACLARQRVWFRYGRPNGEETARQVDPYGIAALYGRWYLVGWCHLRKDQRTFRLDRIRRVDIEEDTFTPPVGFDPVDAIQRSLAMSWSGVEVEVILEGSLDCIEDDLPRSFGILTRIDETHARLVSKAPDLGWFARRLLAVEADITIVRPAALRDAFRKEAQRLLAIADAT